MFTYSGWNAAAYVAEEIRDPGRNVPRALALGTLAVVAIYVLLNLLYLYVLPVGELAAVKGSVLDVVADRLLGPRAGDIMAVVSIVSIAASISAMVFAGPRVYYAMARDGVFFQSAARIHPRFHTPAVSIVGQAIWSGLLVLSGSADALTTYTGFAVVLFAGVAVLALFVLRLREPDAPRPFKALGYPGRSRHSSPSPARSSSPTRSTRISSCRCDTAPPGARRGRPHRRRAGRACCISSSSGGRRRRTPSSASLKGLEIIVRRPEGAGVRISAQSVRAASNPSLAANSRNDRGRAAKRVVEQERRGAGALEQRPHDPHVARDSAVGIPPGQVVADAHRQQEQAVEVRKDGGRAGGTPKVDARRSAASNKKAPTTMS